jgi:hypothetical protein
MKGCPMPQPLSPDQYMAKLNEFLRAHEDFREGMVFVPSPEGSTGSAMWGYEIRVSVFHD